MLKHTKRMAVLAGALTSLTVAPLNAQDPTAGVTGSVRDSSGLAIGGAVLSAVHSSTGFSYRTVVGSSGTYRLAGLPSGAYDITVSRVGYGTVTKEGALLRVGAIVTLDFVMRQAAIELETIRVEQPLIETTRADVSFTIDRDLIRALPDASRQLTGIALLAPGVTTLSNGPPGPGSAVAVGGLNSNSTSVLVDGGSFNEPAVRIAFNGVPRLAVDEVQVLTTSYSAEFGQTASGTINATTRRGSNEWTSEGFVLIRDRALNEKDVFAIEDPDFSRALFGFAIGGPIERNRTHVFFALEATDEKGTGIVNTGGIYPEFDGEYDLPRDEQLILARVDHQLNDSHDFMLRYSGGFRNDRANIGAPSLCTFLPFGVPLASPNFGTDETTSVQSLLVRHRWAMGSRTLNQSTVHYYRFSDSIDPLTVGPTLIYPTLCDGGNAFRSTGTGTRLEFANALSFDLFGTSGEHHMKIGGRLTLTSSDRLENIRTNGFFVLSADHSTEPDFFAQAQNPLINDENNTQVGLFVQDEWRLAKRLTLNLGLRYDVETNGSNQDFVGPGADVLPYVSATPRSIDGDNLSPRLGFAWDADGEGSTVVRGGFGIFYDQLWLWRSAFEPGIVALRVDSPGTLDPDEIDGPTRLVAFPLDSVMPTPFTRQVSLGVEHLLPNGLLVRLDGLLIQGRNLPLTVFRDASSFPEFRNIVQYQNTGWAESSMLMVQVQKSVVWGGLDLAYTLADRKTTVDFWFDFLPAPTADVEDELAPTDWDERHRLTLSGWTRLDLGLRVGMRLVLASARPYTVFDGNVRVGGRNSVRSADYFNTDLSLSWPITLGRVETGLVLNIYNVFNHTNFDPSSYNGNMQSGQFGEPTSAFPRRQLELGLQAAF